MMKLDNAKIGDLFCDDHSKLDTKYLVIDVNLQKQTVTLLFISSRKFNIFVNRTTKNFFVQKLA